jgi:hypothetical protein
VPYSDLIPGVFSSSSAPPGHPTYNWRAKECLDAVQALRTGMHADMAGLGDARAADPLPLTCRTYVSWCPVPLQLVTSQQQIGHRTECGRRGADMTTEPLVGRVVSSQKRP